MSSWQEDVRAIAAKHGVTVAQMKSATRQRVIVRARWEAMRALRDRDPKIWTTPRIGEVFNRDHTTVLYALGRLALKQPQP